MHDIENFQLAGGKMIFTQSWIDDKAMANLILVHGYAEHSSRYTGIDEKLLSAGINVYTFDLTGHGKSSGRKAYINRFQDYVQDLNDVKSKVAMAPNLPTFIYGHSMGALVTISDIILHKSKYDGVIFSAPALKIQEDLSPFLQKISGIMSIIAPKLKTVVLDSSMISRDPVEVDKYQRDPLNYRLGTYARTGAEIIKTTKICAELFHEFELPVFVTHGSADGLTDPATSQQFYDECSSEDKTLKIYEGLYHEIMREPEKEEVIQDIIDWIVERS